MQDTHLGRQNTYLLHQSSTVLFYALVPNEGVLVGLQFNLCIVNVFHVKSNETFGGKYQHDLGENVVYLTLTLLRNG